LNSHPVALSTGGESNGGVTCLHPLSSDNKRVMFGTQGGMVGALEVHATTASSSSSTTTSSNNSPMMELGSPVLCLARSPDGQRVAAATEYVVYDKIAPALLSQSTF
jgi:hypothetical protein